MDQERRIDMIVVHCSDSKDEMEFRAVDIEAWHRARAETGEPWSWYLDADNKPKYIGYHYVVCRDGMVEDGRPISKIGNHAKGVNKNSIGICWIGKSLMAPLQKQHLIDLVAHLCVVHGLSTNDVYGHCQFSQTKTCPNFNSPDTFESIDQFRNRVEMAIREIK